MSLKLTKNEQKKQKDNLKQFNRFLPTLRLKKQQLQSVIGEISEQKSKKEEELSLFRASISQWVELFTENKDFRKSGFSLENYVKVKEVKKSYQNIAGVQIPVFDSLEFEHISWDIVNTPLWVDSGIEALKCYIYLNEQVNVLTEQMALLFKELQITSQRVNLFEKVKIPEAKANIRKISIFLADQQTFGVVRGKIAKGKLAKEGLL